MKKHLSFLFLLFPFIVSAQEYLAPIRYNATLADYHRGHIQTMPIRNRAPLDTLYLPFVEDFSKSEVYPDLSRWMDQKVYINNTFGKDAPSINVATFDGLDSLGLPYSNSQSAYGFADTLTSRPIFLKFPASDSIYLSFYYQPQGNGRPPAARDSLILEFKSPLMYRWTQIRRFSGSAVVPFKQILIPITDTMFLQDGFQFRFRNKGSLFGADDHWNIDYIKLDRIRTYNDTQTDDVSFNTNPTSFLKGYTAVPYNQYDSSLIAANHFVSIRNNFSRPNTNVLFTFTAYETTTNTKIDSATRGIPFGPESSQTEASRKFSFNSFPGRFNIRTSYVVTTPDDVFKSNDTIVRNQPFGDFYAYDDGSAENGYGVVGSNDGRAAYRFNMLNEDTLRAVDIFFTQNSVNVSQKLFTLTIWKNLGPEQIVYQKISLNPEYNHGINGFTRIYLDSPIILNGTFYVGWIQNSDYSLNVGYDHNTENNDKLYYNVDSRGWLQSVIKGSLMIRPVFLDAKDMPVGINPTPMKPSFSMYPNPAQDQLNVRFGESQPKNFEIRVKNLLGQTMLNPVQNQVQLNTSGLQPGLYLLEIKDLETGASQTQKFIRN
jgi:hypothetical protein